jgi:hybrid cluster-associated redox disulfide protein
MEAKIKKEMGIAQVAQNYPESVGVLFKYGMHCIGCHAAQFESLEDGFKAHGFEDKQIEDIVEEMNRIVEEKAKLDEESKKTSDDDNQ